MIFTIGLHKSYKKALDKQQGAVLKTGKLENYVGGYAFKTKDDAQRRIDEAYPNRGFSVWGLVADWKKDTYPNPNGGWWHNLLVDREIIELLESEARKY